VKRLLLILLLTILPLQYSWAAAAVYCQHEREHSVHFGHHGHQHQAQAETKDKSDDGSSIKVHADCVTCHGGSVGIMMMPLESGLHQPLAVANTANPNLLVSTFPPRPERPQWSLAV
jgi:cytochrome c553